MNWFWRFLFNLLGQQAKWRLLREIRRRGLLAYLKALQACRRLMMLLIGVFVALQLMVIGFVGALISGLELLEIDPHTRLVILFSSCLAIFALPFIGLMMFFSERVWFKLSGAQTLMDEMRAPK